MVDRCVLDPVRSPSEEFNTTMVLPFSERLLVAERIIYITVAALLVWFAFEVRETLLYKITWTVAQGCSQICLFPKQKHSLTGHSFTSETFRLRK